MTRKLRNFNIAVWSLAILSVIAFLASRALTHRAPGQPFQVLKVESQPLPDIPAPAFSLTDQDGRPFSSDSLKGKAWVADFFFTTCTGPCPLMTAKMSQLEKKLADPRIHFVSFSIDPESDTPAALKTYAGQFSPTPRWHFLTGGDNATFAIAKALKLPAVPADGTNPIFHTTKFTLVTPAGNVAGYYDFNDPAALDQLARDARRLVN